MNIVEAMTDEKLFGETFGGDSYAAWRMLLSGFYGLPFNKSERSLWQDVTHRHALPREPFDELWLAIGRRGGKSQVAALIGVFEAAFRDHCDKLAPGEWATVMLIAADRAQARTLLRYVRGLFENPLLSPLVSNQTANGLELSNRCAIEVGTASFRSVRGYTLAAVICDEIAFWQADGVSPDVEIIAALRPALATLGGKLIAISSPYARRGVLWSTYRQAFGKDENKRVLVAQAPSRIMNPLLPERIVDDAIRDDAARASAEYLAQFRSDIETFLSIESVDIAQRLEPMELPRSREIKYWGFVDPSGGGADEFTIAVGHREPGDMIVVDALRARKGNPAAITFDFCDFLKSYGVGRVYGDRYGAEWTRTEFRRNGINYQDAPGNRSELYLSFGSALNAGRVELPPCNTLQRQLAALERRTTRGGRDIVDHPPGGHDDRANAVAGIVAVLGSDKRLETTSKTSFVKVMI